MSRWSPRSSARTNDLDDGGREVSAHARLESKPASIELAMWLWCNVSTVDAYGLGQGRNLGCGHPFAPKRGHGAVCVQHAGGAVNLAGAQRDRGVQGLGGPSQKSQTNRLDPTQPRSEDRDCSHVRPAEFRHVMNGGRRGGGVAPGDHSDRNLPALEPPAGLSRQLVSRQGVSTYRSGCKAEYGWLPRPTSQLAESH